MCSPLLITIISLSLLLSPSLGYAQDASDPEATKKVSNELVDQVFHEITALKSKFPQLEAFHSEVLKVSPVGFKEIYYRYQNQEALKTNAVYELYIGVLPLDQVSTFEEMQTGIYSAYDFPLLKVKIVTFQTEHSKLRELKLEKILKEHVNSLWNQEQVLLPFQISLQTIKEVYSKEDLLEVIVNLKNHSKKNWKVKELNESSVQFVFDQPLGDVLWENDSNKKEKTIVLMPGQTISKKFLIQPPFTFRNFTVYGNYILTYQGIHPSGFVQIQIEK